MAEYTLKELSLSEYTSFYKKSSDLHYSVIFNDPNFLTYKGGSAHQFLGFFKNDNLFAAVSFISKIDDGILKISLPGFASFGGIVSDHEIDVTTFREFVRLMILYFQDFSASQIIWTPSMPHHLINADEAMEFSLLAEGFASEVVGFESVVPLNQRVQPLEIGDSKLRNIYKKCLKDEVTYLGAITLDDFWPLLQEVYDRHNTHPTHTYEELKRLNALFPERIYFRGAGRGGKVEAAICNFQLNHESVLVFYMCTLNSAVKYNPMSLLLCHDISDMSQQSIKRYNFGTSSIGFNLRDGVFSFKKQFGSQVYIRKKFIYHYPKGRYETLT